MPSVEFQSDLPPPPLPLFGQLQRGGKSEWVGEICNFLTYLARRRRENFAVLNLLLERFPLRNRILEISKCVKFYASGGGPKIRTIQNLDISISQDLLQRGGKSAKGG